MLMLKCAEQIKCDTHQWPGQNRKNHQLQWIETANKKEKIQTEQKDQWQGCGSKANESKRHKETVIFQSINWKNETAAGDRHWPIPVTSLAWLISGRHRSPPVVQSYFWFCTAPLLINSLSSNIVLLLSHAQFTCDQSVSSCFRVFVFICVYLCVCLLSISVVHLWLELSTWTAIFPFFSKAHYLSTFFFA